jgi:phospholipid/cholesterol/gamma-HCH transport system substrate-binding protein
MFEMKKRLRWSGLKAGLVVSVALVVLFVAVIFADAFKQMLTPTIQLQVRFHDVRGLRRGAPVRLFGTETGSVQKIRLDLDYGAIVTLTVEKHIEPFLRNDSRAEILTIGLLGEKYVELVAGSPEAEPLAKGEMIEGDVATELRDVVQTGTEVIAKVGGLIERTESVIEAVFEGRGTLARLINDPALYENVDRATSALLSVLEGIEEAEGSLKLLIEDPSLYRKLAASAASLEAWTNSLRRSPGSLKKLIEDPALYDKALDAATVFGDFAGKAASGGGTLGKMVEDPELYENLTRSLRTLNGILSGIDEGRGTAGALVRDEDMAEEFKKAMSEIKKLAEQMGALLQDMREDPEKYFKFSIF